MPPAPALTWGDAPWAPGNEVWNGVLRGGRGHHPVWVGPLRPALWAGGPLPAAPPAAPTNLTVRPGR